MPISLHRDLASSGWHSSIVTTYSVDPPFYDLYMERRLRTFGSDNNILMADARMLKVALEAMPEGFAAAGSRYAVLPVKVTGAFHPKVHLRLGERKARLIVGSANSTAAGWGRNQEVIAAIDWRLGDDSSDNQAMGTLVGRAIAYLMRWLEVAPSDAIRYKLQLLRRKSPWLQELQPSRGVIRLSDATAVDLLCESGGGSPSILRQFTDLANADEIRRIVAISPYWDTGLNALRALRNALGMAQTFVALNPQRGTFPAEALPKKDTLKFVAFEGTDAERFLHAKLVVVETRQADHVLFGSANCSDDALGLLSSAARNAEVCLYRRMPPHTVLGELGIDLRRTLTRESISAPPAQPRAHKAELHSAPPGEMELLGKTLTWWPPAGVDAKGATIRIRSVEIRPHALSLAKWTAELPVSPSFPVIASVAYADGQLSDPVIVHGTTRLRRAAPSDIHAALSDALSKARKGEADLLELALQAHIIFAPDHQAESQSSGQRSQKPAEKTGKAVQYATPEEFRNAVALRAASGKTGLFAHDDPGLQEVLSIVLRGINASMPQYDADADEESDDADLIAGDTEDDDSELQAANEEDATEDSEAAAKPTENEHDFTPEEVLRRRGYLLRALDRFYDLLRDLAENPSKITTRIAGQAIFFLWLIRYGCRFEHPGVTRGPSRLMVLYPRTDSEREYSFVIRAMRVLMMLWRGKNAIATHITVDPGHGELHDDLYGLVVHSRWALARAYLLALDGDASLAQRISAAALEILPATHRLGPVNAEAERETMMLLDADLGCTRSQTEGLLRCYEKFETSAKLKVAAGAAAPAPRRSGKASARRT